ncbi:alpha/beta fold hydrolase [Ideonella sp. DXS22W]|uniref:Alpha/beta fold hydrolase n=1 Tax=Pseudaquabacterium inlustre TaxID=2984192 RepID=A0ABU9CCI9_9BURK
MSPHRGLSWRAWSWALACALLGAWMVWSGALPGVSTARAAEAAATGTPPSARALFEPEVFSDALLSPDGRRVAVKVRAKDRQFNSLVVIELATLTPTPVASFSEVGIGQVHWVNDKRLVFSAAAWRLPGNERHINPGLFAVDADGQRFRQLVETRGAFVKNGLARELLPQWTSLHSTARRRDSTQVHVVTVEHYSQRVGVDYERLRRLDTVSGADGDIDAPVHAVAWALDDQDELRAVLTEHENRKALHWREPGGRWRQLAEGDALTSAFTPWRVDPDGTLWVHTHGAGNTLGVYAWDFAAGKPGTRALAVSKDYDLDPQPVQGDGRLLGLRLVTDTRVTHWLDKDLQALQDGIDAALPATTNRLSVARHGDSPWVLVDSHSDTQPGISRLYNRQTRKMLTLGEARPALRGVPMATMDLVHYAARDGLKIPAWLSLPPGTAGHAGGAGNPIKPRQPLPLLLWVHGGPWVRGQHWRWDAEVQFLATRGYAVLQPEFRGSTGFGSHHFEAGWKQWGQAMQDDLADGVRWAVAQGIADPKRVCLIGASYGGYAALMGLVKDPGLYRCAVQWVGVTDPMLMYEATWSDITDAAKAYGYPQLIGDPKADAAMLAANSPLKQAARIQAPVLMAYGEKDQRVPLVHGEKLRDALRARQHPLEWITYPNEGHGWLALETNIDFWGRVERFLGQHLGAGAASDTPAAPRRE